MVPFLVIHIKRKEVRYMKTEIIGNIVDISSGNILRNKKVVINNGIITDILDNLERIEDGFGDTSESDNYLIPGLIDSHLHLLFSGSGTPLQDFIDLDQEGLYELALRNAQMALEWGITTVRDCGSLSDITFKLREDINIGKVIGARVLTSGEAVTTRGGHLNFMGIEADTPEEMNKAAEFMLDKGADFIKLIVSGGNTTPGSKDNVDQYEYENIKSITDYVHSKGKKIMAHVHTKVGMEKCIEAGIDFIEHGSWRTADGIDVDFHLIKKMYDKKITYGTALPKSYFINFEEVHKNRIFTTIENMKYKDNVVIGTDGGTTNNPVKELINQAIYLKEKGKFSNLEILQMLTINPGEQVLDGKAGVIKKGLLGDIVVLKGNPLEDLENLKKIIAVYKEGKRLR
jgi:imidazolonepropionase-like amidohydrolase